MKAIKGLKNAASFTFAKLLNINTCKHVQTARADKTTPNKTETNQNLRLPAM